jgi:hypothetical protein
MSSLQNIPFSHLISCHCDKGHATEQETLPLQTYWQEQMGHQELSVHKRLPDT